MNRGEGPATLPLAGRRVLITRPVGKGQGLAARLAALGASVDSRAAIAFEPPQDAAGARRAAAGIARYDWVVFTSATGVRFFLHQLAAVGLRAADVSAAIAVVGPATASEVESAGLVPALVAEDPRAEGLAAVLARRVAPGTRVLLVQPEVTRPEIARALEEAEAEVDAVAFYRTLATPGIESAAADLARGDYDAVVFSSPSTVHAVCGKAEGGAIHVLGAVKVVAIGEVTGGALASAGRPPDRTATGPTDAEVTAAVVELLVR